MDPDIIWQYFGVFGIRTRTRDALAILLYFAITVFALIIGVYIVLILPISLLAGDYVSLGEFLFGIF